MEGNPEQDQEDVNEHNNARHFDIEAAWEAIHFRIKKRRQIVSNQIQELKLSIEQDERDAQANQQLELDAINVINSMTSTLAQENLQTMPNDKIDSEKDLGSEPDEKAKKNALNLARRSQK